MGKESSNRYENSDRADVDDLWLDSSLGSGRRVDDSHRGNMQVRGRCGMQSALACRRHCIADDRTAGLCCPMELQSRHTDTEFGSADQRQITIFRMSASERTSARQLIALLIEACVSGEAYNQARGRVALEDSGNPKLNHRHTTPLWAAFSYGTYCMGGGIEGAFLISLIPGSKKCDIAP